MSAKNVQPASNGVPPGAIPSDDDGITLPRLEADGTVRVWLRHNVLGGTAGHWQNVDPNHRDLPRLLQMGAVAIPDPITGELLAAPSPPRRSSCCRS